MALSKDQILAIKDITVEEFHVPEWGGSIYLKALTAAEYDAFSADVSTTRKDGGLSEMRAKLCAFSICDEAGNRLFSEREVDVLNKKNAAAITRIFLRAQELSGLGVDSVQEMIKNSKSVQKGDSSSD